jgi:hypothetical protein
MLPANAFMYCTVTRRWFIRIAETRRPTTTAAAPDCGKAAIRTRRSDIHFPTPESSMYCGFDDALSTIVIPPRSCPGFEGVKVTSTLQTAPASRVPLHMSVARKGPVTLIQLNEIDLLPVFLRFTIFGLLVVLTGWAPKAKGEQGENSKTPVFSIEVIASGLLPRRTTSGLWSPLRSPTAAV